MIIWWESLNDFQQVLALIAIPATVIMILQILLHLLGFDRDIGEGQADSITQEEVSTFHHDLQRSSSIDIRRHKSARIFMARTFVAFFAVFSWCGIILSFNSVNYSLSIVISLLAGIIAMLVLSFFL